jgi:hypothetical protein
MKTLSDRMIEGLAWRLRQPGIILAATFPGRREATALLIAGPGSLEPARRCIDASPARTLATLDETSRSVRPAADAHRRLNDPALVRTASETILYEGVASVIDIDQPDLTLDPMSTIAMMIIECAHDAQEHVFQTGQGSTRIVSLETPRPDRGLRVVRDDGLGIAATPGQKRLRRRDRNHHVIPAGYRRCQDIRSTRAAARQRE